EADVWPDQILDRVEHRRVVNDPVDPGEQQMRLQIMALAELPSIRALEAFEPVKIAARLVPAERIDRKDEPVALISRNLTVGKLSAHAASRSRQCNYRDFRNAR